MSLENEAAKNSEIEKGSSIGDVSPPDAKIIWQDLAKNAAEISKAWDNNDLKAAVEPWKRAVELIEKLPSKLTNGIQKMVVEHLMTPWMKAFLKIMESDKRSKEYVTEYYTLKNAILDALVQLSKANK